MDTNVLYAGLRSNTGASYPILDAIWGRRVIPLLSQTVVTEYEEILKFHSSALRLSHADINTILNFLCSIGERVESRGPWAPVLTDPDDEVFVKLAVVGRADCLVTHNLRHFAPATSLGIKLLAPREFLTMIKT